MKWAVLAAVLLLLQAASADPKHQVAIIGGGIGGASSAYFLRQLLGPEVNITILERDASLGGRTASWEAPGGQVFELGASIAWSGNKYIRFLAGEAGLSLNEKAPGSDGGLLAIWDGQQLVFRQSQYWLLTFLRMWWRYGLSYFSLRSRPSDMFQRFSGLYPAQDGGTSWERPEPFLKALGLYDLTQASMGEYLRGEFGNDPSFELFASEVVTGVNRVNYNQNNWQLNALAGLVSLLPATDPTVFSIRGGNQQLAPALAKKAGAGVLTSLDVESVALRSDGRFDVIPSADAATGAAAVSSGGCPCSADGAAEQQEATSDAQLPLQGLAAAAAGGVAPKGGGQQRRLVGQQHEEQQGLEARCRCRCAGAGAAASRTPAANPHSPLGPFDAVILATPLEGSSLTFLGFDPPRMPSRQYQTTITTLVRGAVRPEYFGITDEPAMPFTEVMVTESAQTPFSSLSQVGLAPDGTAIYKLFSEAPIPEATLQQLFQPGYTVLASRGWKAYPRFDPPEDFAPFQLAPGLFYSNPLENAASAMEIAAIAGRNSALLAAARLKAAAGGPAAAASERQEE